MTESTIEGPILSIPHVPQHWFLGNYPDIDPSFLARSYWRLADLYGPIFQLELGSMTAIIVSSYELMKDVMEDDNFHKFLNPQQHELRALIKDGLFTASNEEINWWKAHRILMPVFGPLGVKKMFDQQLDIASQMMLKWDRFGPENEILTSDDFTRLAFDTIGLCGFNYRFNEFYLDIHPFAKQMADSLTECANRASRSKIQNALHVQAERKLWSDIKAQHKLCDDLVAERIKNPKPDVNDLLNVMLNQSDPETGEKLDAENIRYQMATFLIAGHETTSGTLAFLFYHLLSNPDSYHKAQKEVDKIVGTNALTVEHLPKLKYVDACIKETLRWCSPTTMNTRGCDKPQIIGGKKGRYQVKPGQMIYTNMIPIHHDRDVWGDDADDFKPERMLDFDKIPKGAWRPFGFGMRSCIGRAFAEQEILINTALILQRFQVEKADPAYKLELLSNMTIKPKDFKIKVRRRAGRDTYVGLGVATNGHKLETTSKVNGSGKALLIIYGSNAGSCRSYAEDLASKFAQLNYHAEIKSMDSVVEALPTDRPVAIITPSYEGKPADNAKKFVAWLEVNKNSDMLKGVKYFLFGVGNHEWAQTFHKVPKQVDHLMECMGAERIVETCFVDVQEDALGPLEEWCDKVKATLGETSNPAPRTGLKATVSKTKTAKTLAGFDDQCGIVKKNLVLTDDSVGHVKMHMEIELPEDVTYETGDYLAILPSNPREDIRRVLTQFKLNPDDEVTITNTEKKFLQSDEPFSVFDLIATRVELSTPVSQKQLKELADATEDSKQKGDLLTMAGDHWAETMKKRFSIIDVLEDHPSCKIDFESYLDMLKVMSARQYSISSTMLDHHVNDRQATASITYDVYETKAWSGNNRTFHGVASSHLADLKAGNQVRCTVRPTNAGFHLPKELSTPIIMVASGTGMAPMRGFIEERAALKKARDAQLGPALFYFGCRDVDNDYIYKAQFEEWEKQGVVSMRPTFSKHGPDKDSFKYTYERIYAEKDELGKLVSDGAKIFVCGSASKLAKSTAEVFKKIWLEVFPDKNEGDADDWLNQMKEDRYVSDVFG